MNFKASMGALKPTVSPCAKVLGVLDSNFRMALFFIVISSQLP